MRHLTPILGPIMRIVRLHALKLSLSSLGRNRSLSWKNRFVLLMNAVCRRWEVLSLPGAGLQDFSIPKGLERER